ncbi:MAG TPA: TolC family protein, partial [Burkholderiaceae bacterium]|nr:TolC family protein [Burkholderiaceae bacterium]
MTMTTSQRARPRLIALIAAGAFAGACTVVGPDYQRPDVSLPEQFGPEAAEAGVGAPVAPEWWQLYRDPTLNDLIASARTRNADIRIAVAQLEEAEALLREAQATLFPQIDLGATGSRGQVTRAGAVPVPPNAPVVRSDLRLIASTAFELDFWGRLQRVAEAARAQALASRHARDVVALTLSGTTAQTY